MKTPPCPVAKLEGGGRRAKGVEADLRTVRGEGVFSYPDKKSIFKPFFFTFFSSHHLKCKPSL